MSINLILYFSGFLGLNGSYFWWKPIRYSWWTDVQFPTEDTERQLADRSGTTHWWLCPREDGCNGQGADRGESYGTVCMPGLTVFAAVTYFLAGPTGSTHLVLSSVTWPYNQEHLWWSVIVGIKIKIVACFICLSPKLVKCPVKF